MGDRLKGKVAIVTGSGQGVGEAVAVALAKEGAKVVTNNRRAGTSGGDAETTARQITDAGGQATPFFGDVSSFELARQLIQTAVDKFGRLDILINNAGNLRERMIWNLTEEDWDSVIATHLKGTYNCTRWAAPLMREQRSGRIINVTSMAWRGTTGQCNYSAAKGGIVSFTYSMARELGRYGITCNCIAPRAATRMNMREEVIAASKKKFEQGLITKEDYEARANKGGPEHNAPIFVYLATDEAANINGQVFHIAKGRVSIFPEPRETRAIFSGGGVWTMEQLVELVPKTLLVGYTNLAPAAPPK
jgi:3-oxoacyl-[acyl-carrier protein] reductase